MSIAIAESGEITEDPTVAAARDKVAALIATFSKNSRRLSPSLESVASADNATRLAAEALDVMSRREDRLAGTAVQADPWRRSAARMSTCNFISANGLCCRLP